MERKKLKATLMKHLYQVTFLILCNIKLPFNLVIATFTETNQAPIYYYFNTAALCALYSQCS